MNHRLALLALAATTLASCSSPPAAVWVAPPPLPLEQPAAMARPPEITLAFAGDVHFAGRTRKLLGDPATTFGPAADVLRRADVAMLNLETAITDRGTPEPKEFHFRAPAAAVTAVRAAGVDVVSVANNHALDYGEVGLVDTLDATGARGLPAVGGGLTPPEAYAPWVTSVRGVRVAFLAVSQIQELQERWRVLPGRPGIAMAGDTARAAEAVRAARTVTDVVVLYVHWGSEGSAKPTPEMRRFARLMAEAGADIVVGTHAHLLLGEERIGATHVQYGLGNFVWWRNDAFSNDTGVWEVTLRGNQVARTRLVPMAISRRTGQPRPATGGERRRISRAYEDLSQAAAATDAPPPELAPGRAVG